MTRIPKEILAEYENKKARAKHEYERRRTFVFKESPEIEKLEENIRCLAYELGLHSMGLSPEDYASKKAETKECIDSLKNRQAKLLASMKLPADYIRKVPYACDKCEDTGFIGLNQCICLKQRMMQYEYASSNIDNMESFETFDFNIFQDPNQKKQIKQVYSYAKDFADTVPQITPPNLLLIGAAGLGKTFILNCIAKRCFERGLTVVKIAAYNLINATMKVIKGEEPAFDFYGCDVLLIDDLGTEPQIPNITTETLFSIINERGSNHKPIVIATNKKELDIKNTYDERICSRLLSIKNTAICSLEGNDLRQS